MERQVIRVGTVDDNEVGRIDYAVFAAIGSSSTSYTAPREIGASG